MSEKVKVALVGLDGCGKSTNIDRMKQDEDFQGFGFLWVRWEPTLLAPAYWILNRKVRKKENHEDQRQQLNGEYGQKSKVKGRVFRNPIVRHIWLFLAVLDYFLQFYVKTFHVLIQGKPIVFDRFYLDLFVDQGISFGYTPEQIAKLVKRNRWLFPKVNQTLYIKVDPEVCYNRKNDIPNMDYLVKRYEVYEAFAREFCWVVIDGEEPLESVYAKIKEQILT